MVARPRNSAVALGLAVLVCAPRVLAQPEAPERPPATAMPVTLDEAVVHALARNPTFATALLEARRADAVVTLRKIKISTNKNLLTRPHRNSQYDA